MVATNSFTMSARDFLAHSLVASCTSGKNCVANARMMPCVTSPAFWSSFVTGVALSSKRAAACTAKPSQCPDARASFTMRAHAAAWVVSSHGDSLPSTHAAEPNMVTRSSVLKYSLVTEEPKLAKLKPFANGCNPESAGSAVTAAELPDPPLQPATAATMSTAAMMRRVVVKVLFMTLSVSYSDSFCLRYLSRARRIRRRARIIRIHGRTFLDDFSCVGTALAAVGS